MQDNAMAQDIEGAVSISGYFPKASHPDMLSGPTRNLQQERRTFGCRVPHSRIFIA
jgi:hypothetical protein